jgi:hypothetical protein
VARPERHVGSSLQLVDRSCEQVLANRQNSAADLYVEVARGRLGLGERHLDPVGDEMEGRPPSITIGARAWLVRTKVGAWYGGLSPHQPFQSGPPQSSPAGPNILRPRMKAPKPSAVGAGEAIVGAAVFSDHRSKGPGREEPIHQFLPPFAERMLQALVRPAPKPSMDTPKPATRTLPIGASF